jgi:hypothetical protein
MEFYFTSKILNLINILYVSYITEIASSQPATQVMAMAIMPTKNRLTDFVQ